MFIVFRRIVIVASLLFAATPGLIAGVVFLLKRGSRLGRRGHAIQQLRSPICLRTYSANPPLVVGAHDCRPRCDGSGCAWGLDAGRELIGLVEAHAYLGIAFAIGLALRLLWAVIGPKRHDSRRSGELQRSCWISSRYASPLRLRTPRGCRVFRALRSHGSRRGIRTRAAAIRFDVGPLLAALFDDFSRHAFCLVSHDVVSYVIIAFVPAHIIGRCVTKEESAPPLALSRW